MKNTKHTQLFKRLLASVLSMLLLFSSSVIMIIPVGAIGFNLLNPITGTVQGAGYDETAGHYGIDLYPYNYGDPVYAVASGTIMYSCERNHTREYQSGDDCCTVKIILDEPITYNGTTYVCAFYTHMSSLVYDIYCGYKSACIEEYNAGLRTGALPTESIHVEAGDIIGYVGKGNGATHLHFSFEASEADGYAMMPNSEYYDVFGWEYSDMISSHSVNNTVYTTTTGVKAKLDAFIKQYPNGSRWIKSNGADEEFDNSYECYGFAGLVVYNIFGKNSSGGYRWWNYSGVSTSGMITLGSITNFSADNVKALLSNAKCGDVLQFNTPSQHSMIVYSVESDGMTIYDCNWDLNNGIRLKKLSYGAWNGRNSTKLTLLRSNNYAEIGDDSPTITPDTCTCSTSYAGTYICTTSSYPLTIRSGHGVSYSAIGSIPSGASISVTKANGSWAHITYNGVSGFVSMEYLKKPLSSTSVYPLPFKCYPLKDSQYAADAYDSVNGNHIGYIYNTDYCTVKEIYSNGWCLVNCPWNDSTKDVYTWTGNFINTSGTPYTKVIEQKADTYIRLGSSSTLGWVDPGDTVTIIDESYQNVSPYRIQIIYPHSDGTYRCAWVTSTALVHTHTPGAAATCTSPQVCTTCDATIVNAYGHSAGATATCTNPQICTRCGIVINDAKGHTLGAAATCTTAQTCTTCGVTLVNALGHSAGAAATCTAPQTCTRCGTIMANIKDHTPGATATCTTAQTCTKCGTTITPAKGHSYTAGDYTDPTHPHKIYNTCSCGAEKDTGTTATVSNCVECYPAPTVSGITYTPSTVKVGDTVTFTLNAIGSTAYEFAIGDGTDRLLYTGKMSNNSVSYTFENEGVYYISGNAYNGETIATAQTISVTVSPETVPVTVSFAGKLCAFMDSLYIRYYFKTDTDSENINYMGTLLMSVDDFEAGAYSELTLDNATINLVANNSADDQYATLGNFALQTVYAKDINTVYKVRPYLVLKDGTVVYGETEEYGLSVYLTNQINKPTSAAIYIELLNHILEYGEIMQRYINR